MLENIVDVALPLVVAAVLGGIVGLDRELRHQAMGLRTFILISTGSALFTQLSIELTAAAGTVDPARGLQGIVAGIGVLGMGAILQRGSRVRGATTGASVWIIGAIGAACGLGYFAHAAIATAIVMIALVGLGAIEHAFKRRKENDSLSPDEERRATGQEPGAPSDDVGR